MEGREKKRERNISVREKYWLVASCMHPNQGLNPHLRHVPQLGIELVNFSFAGQCPMKRATPIKAEFTFLRFHISVGSYGICFSVSDLFHLAQCHQYPSMLLQMTGFPSFSWLNNILLLEKETEKEMWRYHTFLTHSPIDENLHCSMSWLQWIMLQRTQGCRYLFEILI